MSLRKLIVMMSLVVAVAGCDNVFHVRHLEQEYLAEDVIDLMTVVMQAADNAYVGDIVFPEDVLDPARPGNGFTVIYDLPADVRLNLGFGFGEAELQVTEDGVVSQDPLGFAFRNTTANEVEIYYRLIYRGEAQFTRRNTDVDLVVNLRARRGVNGFDLVDYNIDGWVDIGATECTALFGFTAFGRPRDGIEVGTGDGEGEIDDPEVFDYYDYDIDFFANEFRVEGEVGFCCHYDDWFDYRDIF